jgi:hypothetical protein
MATLRMPDRLAREIIAYCITATPQTSRSDELLRMLIAGLGDLSVESARIETNYEGRHAYVVVDAAHARDFTRLFPAATRLREHSHGKIGFRLNGCAVTEHVTPPRRA